MWYCLYVAPSTPRYPPPMRDLGLESLAGKGIKHPIAQVSCVTRLEPCPLGQRLLGWSDHRKRKPIVRLRRSMLRLWPQSYDQIIEHLNLTVVCPSAGCIRLSIKWSYNSVQLIERWQSSYLISNVRLVLFPFPTFHRNIFDIDIVNMDFVMISSTKIFQVYQGNDAYPEVYVWTSSTFPFVSKMFRSKPRYQTIFEVLKESNGLSPP